MNPQVLARTPGDGVRTSQPKPSRSPAISRARTAPGPATLARCQGACACGGACRQPERDDELGRQLQRAVAGRVGAGRGPILARATMSPRFRNEPLLEACADNKARMNIGARDTAANQPVSKVQQALIERGLNLGTTGPGGKGADGVYGSKTADAVRLFKAREDLGSKQFGDVGPGTMGRLNALFPGEVPPSPTPPTPPPPAPIPPTPPPPTPISPDDQKHKDAMDDRRKQLRAVERRLGEMMNVVLRSALAQPGEGPFPTVTQAFPREVCVVSFFLHTQPSAPDYLNTLAKARALVLSDLTSPVQPLTFRSTTTGFCDPGAGQNFAATCAPGTCVPLGTHLCDPTWYDSSRQCRSDVLIHETYHWLGLPNDGVDFPAETKPADAFQNADTMTQFGNALMGLAIDNCVSTQRKTTAFPAAMTTCQAAPPTP